jgi:hypothetical protein
MARTIRHSKLDSRTSRAQLPVRNNPYWQAITRGRALGYRKGGKGGTWIAKYRSDDGARAQTLLGPADDALDAETAAVMTFAQAQAAARNWFALLDKNAGRRPEPYTVGQALNDYLANFSGKSLQKTRYTVERHLRPEFGELEVTELTTERLINYVNRLANTPSVYRKTKRVLVSRARIKRMPCGPKRQTQIGYSRRCGPRSIALLRWARYPTTPPGDASNHSQRWTHQGSATSPQPRSRGWSQQRRTGFGR